MAQEEVVVKTELYFKKAVMDVLKESLEDSVIICRSISFEGLGEVHDNEDKDVLVIRKGTFSKYDYGLLGNLKYYRRLNPPLFSLGDIPESLPLWIGYGGNDALADLTDLRRTMKELRSKPEALYIDYYGHIDFILGVDAKNDVYGDLIRSKISFIEDNHAILIVECDDSQQSTKFEVSHIIGSSLCLSPGVYVLSRSHVLKASSSQQGLAVFLLLSESVSFPLLRWLLAVMQAYKMQ
ncbi:hypothetical protein HPP92_008255 [Vanilla planifolia]|uniref:Uncharacterized protein n=1 Tax=Vanilla planifolia TaxID=51239 RepID=A0A835R266_VANPL|nr:hypothetical protein HPP92_008255 [Vanilla planifolia]